MPDTMMLGIMIPVDICASPTGAPGLVLTEHGEILLATGDTATRIRLGPAEWAWLSQVAGQMASALSLGDVTDPTHVEGRSGVAGHA